MSDAADWQVESLRVTAFPQANSEISPTEIWARYIGVEPAEVQIQRDRINARHVEWANGVIFLVSQRDRIEWRYVAPQDESQYPRFPVIGSLQSELDEFARLADSWLTSRDVIPMVRLAFGAVLLRPETNIHKSHETLQRFLPFLHTENLTEFSYRVNRRRVSKTLPETPINRIAQWSLARFRSLDIALEQAEVHMSSAGESLASRLELDVNTLQGRSTPLPSEHSSALFHELVGLALEISLNGDSV